MALYHHGLVAALGIFFIVVGVVIPKLIQWQVRDALRNAMCVSGPSDSGYAKWMNPDRTANRNFRAYELTNPAAFMAGAAPNFAVATDAEVVSFEYYRHNVNANFTADSSSVDTLVEVQYTVSPSSPAQPTKKYLSINWAYLTLVQRVGSETNLWGLVASKMLGTMLQTSSAGWVGNSAFCLQGTICGLAYYHTATSAPVPAFNGTQLGLLGQSMAADQTWLGYFTNYVSVINNVNTPSQTRLGVIAAANTKFPFFDFTPNSPVNGNDAAYFAQYLGWLVTQSASTIVAAYKTTPYPTLLFKNATITDHVFNTDPLVQLLGLRVSLLTNLSRYTNTILTGCNDDTYLGMDYFTMYSSTTIESRYPGTNFSAAGRQVSITPFQSSRPDHFDFFFGTIMRHVEANYTADASVKDVPVWHYDVNTYKLLAVDPNFGVKARGFLDLSYISSGAPFWASLPKMGEADPAWTSKVTGIPAMQESDKSFLRIEGTTGVAIEGNAQLLFNIFLNFTAYSFAGFSAQSGKEYPIPAVEVQDYRILTDSQASDLYAAVVKAPRIERIILLVLVIIGAVILAVAIITYLRVLWVERNNDGSTEDGQTGASGTMNGVDKTIDNEMGATSDARNGFPGSGTTDTVPNPLISDGQVVTRDTAGEGM